MNDLQPLIMKDELRRSQPTLEPPAGTNSHQINVALGDLGSERALVPGPSQRF